MTNRPPTAPFRQLDSSFRMPSDGHRLGALDAEVNMVVLSDYRCRYCAQLWERVERYLVRYPTLAVTYYHSVRGSGPDRVRPAIAANCAGSGEPFRTMSRLMFEHMDSLDIPDLVRYAQAAGVSDTAGFAACLGDIAMVQAVMQEKMLSARLGVRGTPVIVLQGKVYEGIPWDLDALLRGAMHGDGVMP